MHKGIVLLAIAASLLTIPAASAHDLGVSAVSGRRIAYTESSRYNSAIAHAVSVWNALNTDTNVTIAPAAGGENVDLKWADTYNDGVLWYGIYRHYSAAADTIHFNTYYLGTADGGAMEDSISAHELGHALRLAHNTTDNTQLMDPCPGCSSSSNPRTTRPMSHDKADYYAFWP